MSLGGACMHAGCKGRRAIHGSGARGHQRQRTGQVCNLYHFPLISPAAGRHSFFFRAALRCLLALGRRTKPFIPLKTARSGRDSNGPLDLLRYGGRSSKHTSW